MSKDYKINEDYLDELIKKVSERVVGKVMKRYDLFGESPGCKKVTKELIYEGFREFRDLVIAHNHGLHITTFNFKHKEGTNPTHKD